MEVVPVSFDEMTANRKSKTVLRFANGWSVRRQIQAERFKDQENIYCNAMMASNQVKEICAVNDGGKSLLKTAMERLGFPPVRTTES